MSASLKEALASLKVEDDNHWTADGLPRVDALKALTGDQALTRDVVSASFPAFTRATADKGPQEVQTPPPATNTDPAAAAAAAGAGANTEQGKDTPAPKATVTPPPPPAAPVAPKVQAPPTVLSDEEKAEQVAALTEEADCIKEWIAGNEKEIEARKAQGVEARKALEKVETKLVSLLPPDTNQAAISNYLATQRAVLAQRGQQMGAVKAFQAEHGVKLADLIPKKAPIDAAMSRKSNRGANRPAR